MALSENPTLEEIIDEAERLNNLVINRGGTRTITPSTTNQVLSKGNYKGDITILGDSDLIASNIKSGVNIFGVTGTLPPMKQDIYNRGVESVPLKTYIYDRCTITKNPTDITVYCESRNYCRIMTEKIVPTKTYSYIALEIENLRDDLFGNIQMWATSASDIKSNESVASVAHENINKGGCTLYLDVSKLSNDYYLRMQFRSMYVRINKISLVASMKN